MKFKKLSVASSLAIAACIGTPAFAQDESAAQEDSQTRQNQTNVIVVTAEFREANLQDTPIAITAVNADMLEARGQTDISQVANQAPNVTLTPQPQNGGSGLIAFIRGVGQVDFNYALDPGVGVYVDDVFIPTLSASLLELMDLDRIEVLRGPQGTLAGKNSIGGSIKLFSARPKGDGSGYLRATYGSFDRIEMRGMADFAVTEDVAVRVSGFGRSVDGYVTQLDYGLTHPGSNVPSNLARGRDNADRITMGGSSTAAGRIALRWEPSDRFEWNISADYTSTQGEAGPTVLIAAGQPTGGAFPFDPFSSNPATDANGNPWLVGVDGTNVPVNCAFVPTGPYSCDTLSGDYGDPGFIAYSNFLDAKEPTQQAPYKPYFALQNQDFSGWGVHSNMTYDVSDNMQLVWIASWREYESIWGQDQDATPVPVAQLDNQLNHRAWSHEVRLNFEVADGFVEGTVGGFYLDQDGEYTARVDLNYAGIDFIHGPDTTPSTTKAVFATATVRPTDMLSFTGGIRYTKDKKTYTYFRSNPDGTVPFREADNLFIPGIPACEFFLGAPTAGPTGIGNTPNCLLTGLFDVPGEFKGDRWDWRIAADYRFSDQFLTYASVTTGFKGGGVNPRPFFGPSAGDCSALPPGSTAPCNQINSFNPETIITYEVGFKADLLDRTLRLNGAAFWNDYSDIILQLTACPGSPCLQPNNVGSAEVKGFELEFSAYPVDGLSLDGGIAYLDFQYTDTGTSGLTGDEITPYTPEWSGSLGIQYDYDFSGGSMMARLDGAYQSKIFTEANNSIWSRIDSRFLANARVAYTTPDEDWTVALEVRNLLDKYYYLSVSDVTGSLGVVTGVPGMPRTFAVSVQRDF
ncbi:TonB-dependent receptor [Aurantiacibacter rhizosphaerae]|uniref:TonB-dependent receptor n=1 Tax=Aurantiacibacter rhizosphaerae TaxID=2691582 RepID=A0A844X9P0_9SPHN|nr:TonB-dependent receptor [Aurantiacibacter rhizosphaerae]MWV26472.1 TonB-dependent receptor [Aurantiacibacter rhizosphaerae]